MNERNVIKVEGGGNYYGTYYESPKNNILFIKYNHLFKELKSLKKFFRTVFISKIFLDIIFILIEVFNKTNYNLLIVAIILFLISYNIYRVWQSEEDILYHGINSIEKEIFQIQKDYRTDEFDKNIKPVSWSTINRWEDALIRSTNIKKVLLNSWKISKKEPLYWLINSTISGMGLIYIINHNFIS